VTWWCHPLQGDIQAGSGLVARGCLDLGDTTVRGTVVLRRARLHHPAGTALKHVGGDVNCRDGLFGQERVFNAHGAMQWTVVVLVSAGWILATTAAAGANRILRRA
jgi:hypothetical protein